MKKTAKALCFAVIICMAVTLLPVGSYAATSSSQQTVKTTEKVKVLVTQLNMRKSYTTSSKSMGKAKKNKTYQLKSKTADGEWGQMKNNGYWIYLKNGYTKKVVSSSSSAKSSSDVVTTTEKVKVTVSQLNMRKSYTTSSKSMGKAKKNKIYQLKAKTKDGKWGQMEENGYWIYLPGYTEAMASEDKSINVTDSDKLRQELVDYALQFVGNPYVYGGESLTEGTDCSGFTMKVYEKFGIDIPRRSTDQHKIGTEVPYSEAKPGDIVCYSGHVALYIGDGKVVHASTSKTGIIISKATYRTILSVRCVIE